MPEDRLPISSSRVTAVDVARHSFTTVRRGFEISEVRSYLEHVARELATWEQRYDDLRAQLAEAEEQAAHPVIDEGTLAHALGEQSAQILRNAHAEAARIIQTAEDTAAATVRQAQLQATEAAVRAESAAAERIAEAEIAAGSVHQRAAEEVAAATEGANREAEAIVEEARHQGRSMIEQAHEARRRVLADLAQRRRSVMLQIEQFRAARDQVGSSIVAVRREMDRILSDLSRADDEARAAAAEVARRGAVAGEGDLLAEGEQAVAGLSVSTPPEEPPAPSVLPETMIGLTESLSTTPAGGPDDTQLVPSVTEPMEPGPGYEPEPPPVGLGPEEPATEEPPWAVSEPEPVGSSVEGLFARLRAGQDGENEEPDRTSTMGHEVGSAVASPEGPPAESVAEEVPASVASEEEPVGEGPGSADEAEAPPPEAGPDDVARGRRAELLDPVVAKLARRLKRALQDDQNRVLDRLRAGDGGWSAEVMGPETEHRETFAGAALPFLEEALKAGIAFGRNGGRTARVTGADRQALGELADSLAGTVVTLLRRRMGEEEGGGDDASERVGAAYREWRGERIERLVGDSALSAFSLGVIRGAGRGAHLRWVLAGTGHDCADCEDNALAESLEAGAEFPTGHRHPPAHAGCRCLIVTVG